MRTNKRIHYKTKLSLISIAIIGCVSTYAQTTPSARLGELTVRSSLGQPLDIQININSEQKEDIQYYCFSVTTD